jgi:hypothetical protein
MIHETRIQSIYKARWFIIAGFIIALGISGCASLPKERSAIFQYSAINALMEGVYDSGMTVGELSRYGDFGIRRPRW